MEERDNLAVVYLVLLLSGRSLGFMETSMPNDYMICRPVSGVFGALAAGTNGTDKSIMPALQGPEGSAGHPGKTGLIGPRGEPDYQKVSTIVQDKVQSINARIFKLETEIAAIKASGGGGGGGDEYVRTTQSPEGLKNEKECMDKYNAPIHMDSMCYAVIGGEGLWWTFDTAESNCTKLGGYLADLNSRALYDKIYDYIDQTYSTVVQAWTGMRYEDDKLLRTDGQQASFVKWMAYNPRKWSSSFSSFYRSYTYVYVNVDSSSRINGLQNTPPTRKLAYAICHFDIGNSTTTRRSTTKQTTITTKRSWDLDSDYADYYY